MDGDGKARKLGAAGGGNVSRRPRSLQDGEGRGACRAGGWPSCGRAAAQRVRGMPGAAAHLTAPHPLACVALPSHGHPLAPPWAGSCRVGGAPRAGGTGGKSGCPHQCWRPASSCGLEAPAAAGVGCLLGLLTPGQRPIRRGPASAVLAGSVLCWCGSVKLPAPRARWRRAAHTCHGRRLPRPGLVMRLHPTRAGSGCADHPALWRRGCAPAPGWRRCAPTGRRRRPWAYLRYGQIIAAANRGTLPDAALVPTTTPAATLCCSLAAGASPETGARGRGLALPAVQLSAWARCKLRQLTC